MGAAIPTDVPLAVEGLTKYFGAVRAVNELSFSVQPGRVTGFLGPNGAGKTTTLRMLLGLVRPTRGTALVAGRCYADLDDPLRTVGAALEATSFHPGRTARNHLRVVATAARLPVGRVDEVLALVGLAEAGNRRVGGFSLGMRQRLGLATTMLGDPRALILDEPANGLDPEGIVWLRGFLRQLAGEGRTVLVSSHVLSEVEQTVDDVVIIERGQLVRAAPLAALSRTSAVFVRSPDSERLRAALSADGLAASGVDGRLRIEGVDSARVGSLAFRAGIEVHELYTERSDLEQVFLELTGGGSPGTASEQVAS